MESQIKFFHYICQLNVEQKPLMELLIAACNKCLRFTCILLQRFVVQAHGRVFLDVLINLYRCLMEPVEVGTKWIEHFAIMSIDFLMDRWLKLACLNFGISKSSISREEECRLHFSVILCWKVAEDSNGRVLASNQSFHRFLLPDQMKENLQFNYWNQHINEMASLVCSKKYLKWSIYHTGFKLSDNIKDS